MIVVPIQREKLLVGCLALAAFVAYAIMFLRYLPDSNGMSGPDYGYFLPQLLAGYFWFEKNGLLSIPWFTPAFCGGIPYYPNMQGMYVSLPQFLTFAFGPIHALQLTFLTFAGAGFAGFYVLLRRAFAVTAWVALAGGVLFLFNGFFVTRFVVGHLTFHAFMLAPLLAACVLAGQGDNGTRRTFDAWVLVAGLLIGYMVQSGMVHALPPVMAGVVIFILVHGILFGLRAGPFIRLAFAASIALALSAAKLVAALAFMSHFPREMLPLLGYGDMTQVIAIAILSLFVVAPYQLAANWTVNNEWYENTRIILAYHEYDYGITFLPVLIIGVWLGIKAVRLFRRNPSIGLQRAHIVIIAAIGFILVLPLVLNWYDPTWNKFLKQLPYVRNSSTMVRWFSLYILVFILFTALILQRARIAPQIRIATSLLVVAGVVVLNAGADRSYYRQKAEYDLHTIDQAYLAVRKGSPVPAITRVERLRVTNYAGLMRTRNRNDILVSGTSQGQCYEPMFGHRLEEFPFGPMRTGPTLRASNGLLNIKNPACFVYPKANNCKAGDHFKDGELAAATRFANYQSFEFKLPWWQHVANWLSLITLIGVILGLGFYAVGSLRRHAPVSTFMRRAAGSEAVDAAAVNRK